MATLVATDPGGEKWEDPSEDLLYMFLEDLARANGPSACLHLERLNTAEKETLVVRYDKGRFGVRRQRGPRGATAASESLREMHAACARWALQIDSVTAARIRQVWGGYDGTLAWQITESD
jgi:hypothetical protein